MSRSMPYPVVSRGIIKSALSWHNLPIPSLILDGNFDWPNGDKSCMYKAEWNQAELEKAIGEPIPHDGSAGYSRLMGKLRDCFCADITIVELFSNQNGVVMARFYCKMPCKQKRDYLLPVTGK